MNIDIITADIGSATTNDLTEIFKNFHTVISCTGMTGGPGTQLKIVNAVLNAAPDVKRYLPWQFGIDYDSIGRGSGKPLFDEQLDVRDILRAQSKVEWIIVSVGMFTSFLFEPSSGVVDLGDGERPVVRALGSWDTSVSLTTPEDIGRVTAAIIGHEDPEIKDTIVYCTGDTITYRELADMVERVLGKKVERVEFTTEVLEEKLRADPGNGLVEYQLVFGAGKGTSWTMEKTFNYKYGMRLTSAEEWAVANLKGYSS